MTAFTLSESELESFDLWDMVEKIKEKILWDTENDNREIQALMLSFEVNQVINELLKFSIDFTRNIVLHK